MPPWLRHDAVLAHDIPGHPERPARIIALEAEMERHDWFGWERVEAPRATREQLERVHPAAHVDRIEALAAAGGGAIDLDTSVVPGTWEAALRAAGGRSRWSTRCSAPASRAGSRRRGRPATTPRPARAMGFCFFNNVAVAARTRRPRTAPSGC